MSLAFSGHYQYSEREERTMRTNNTKLAALDKEIFRLLDKLDFAKQALIDEAAESIAAIETEKLRILAK
jgi:hypothetical protein